MKPATFSPEMRAAIDCALEHGGKLIRYPGGFWSYEGWGLHHGVYFGTTTIEAIVKRGAGEYTNQQRRRDGSTFPIEVTVTL